MAPARISPGGGWSVLQIQWLGRCFSLPGEGIGCAWPHFLGSVRNIAHAGQTHIDIRIAEVAGVMPQAVLGGPPKGEAATRHPDGVESGCAGSDTPFAIRSLYSSDMLQI